MDQIQIKELQGQLGAIESLLAEDPTNEDMLHIKAEIEEMLKLTADIQELKAPKLDMFADDSDEDSLTTPSHASRDRIAEKYLPKEKRLLFTSGATLDPSVANPSVCVWGEDGRTKSYSHNVAAGDDEDETSDSVEEKDSGDDVFEEKVPEIVQPIVSWEKYTKGFGSKMLVKYGFKYGEGLGPKKTGISKPIPIHRQAGNTKAGLGHEKRENLKGKYVKEDEEGDNGGKGNGKRGKSEGKSEGKSGGKSEEKGEGEGRGKKRKRSGEGQGLFQWLNVTLNHGEDVADDEDKLRAKKRQKKESFSGLDKSQLELTFKEKQKQKLEVEQSILKYDMAVQRNLKKDPNTAKIFQKKLEEAKDELKKIEAQEKELQVRMDIKKDTQKISKNFM